MRTTRLALCAFAALAGTAYGAQSIEGFTQIEETQVYDVRTGQWIAQSPLTGSRGTATIYSNIANPTQAGVQQSVDSETVADDVNPANLNQFTGNPTVAEMTISIANFGPAINNQPLSLDLVFFANDALGAGGVPIAGTEVGRASVQIANFSLGAQTFGLFSFTGLDSIMSPVVVSAATFWAGVQFEAGQTNLGQVFYGPGTVGSSNSTKYYRDSGANPAFSNSSTNNFALEIIGIPAPGAIALFGLGGLYASRRRRS